MGLRQCCKVVLIKKGALEQVFQEQVRNRGENCINEVHDIPGESLVWGEGSEREDTLKDGRR